MQNIEIKTGYIPGIIGRVAELHALYYSEHWDFGHFFEIKVASEMAQFINEYSAKRDCIWSVSVDDRIEGSITIDGSSAQDKGAHLRWFIVSDALRGKGAGKRLIEEAMKFCREKEYSKVYLWTFEGLGAARHLYEKAGFSVAEEKYADQWGTKVREQRFEFTLSR